MCLLLRICSVLSVFSLAYGMKNLNVDYGTPVNAEDDLMQDFYKRLALVDLQDVKRSIGNSDDDYDGDVGNALYESYDRPQGDVLYTPPSHLKLSDRGVNNDYDGGRYKNDVGNLIDDSSYHSQKQLRDMEEEEIVGGDDDKLRGVIRDPELTEHSSIYGILHLKDHDREHGKPTPSPSQISDNVKPVKADETLPFYCHPPNPCPKGFTSKDGCQEFIEDTSDYQKEWIKQMQRKGLCACDEEHMFDCSYGTEDEEDREFAGSKEELEKVFDKLIKEKQENPFTNGGQKRVSLVAKKSPRIKRDINHNQMEEEILRVAKKSSTNPYLDGARLPTVAKKGHISRS